MSTLYVFKVTYLCGGGCGHHRKITKKALEKVYGESIKFNMVEDKIIAERDAIIYIHAEIVAERDAIIQAKIIAELQKLKWIMKAELVLPPPKKDSTCTGGGGGGSNANGAKVPNNGGNMGLMVPPNGQYGPHYYHPGPAMNQPQQPRPINNNQHYGYLQPPRPMDDCFSNENPNGCSIM